MLGIPQEIILKITSIYVEPLNCIKYIKSFSSSSHSLCLYTMRFSRIASKSRSIESDLKRYNLNDAKRFRLSVGKTGTYYEVIFV